MQATAESNPFLASAREASGQLPDPTGGPLAALRKRGLERFEALGFPTTRMEDWRSTSVAPLALSNFSAGPTEAKLTSEDIAPHTYAGTCTLVFVDGVFSSELSSLPDVPEGVFAGTLRDALEEQPIKVMKHLGKYARLEDQAFVALGTSHLSDGFCFLIPNGVVVEVALHVLFVSATAGVATYPRLLVVAGENSQATFVESYVALHEGEGFNGPISEFVLGANAVVDHYKIQRESLGTFHIATQQVYQGRSSTLRSHSISIGGRLVRNDVNGVLDAEGISCTLNGLYLVDGDQHVDNHMRVDHAKPNCYSHELFKGILDGGGRSVFNGLIHVHPDAQKTDAVQSNRNLLLSKNALASSNPQLEIFADDVRCTHGSTIGQLDEDAIFYLRSRGIGEAAARSLLTYAFASDIVERIKITSVREEMEEFLFHRLPHGEIVRQAV